MFRSTFRKPGSSLARIQIQLLKSCQLCRLSQDFRRLEDVRTCYKLFAVFLKPWDLKGIHVCMGVCVHGCACTRPEDRK